MPHFPQQFLFCRQIKRADGVQLLLGDLILLTANHDHHITKLFFIVLPLDPPFYIPITV